MDHVLFIGMVWPEPTSSAAGTRIIQLVQAFQELGMRVSFATAASKTAFSYDLERIGVREYAIRLNEPSFDGFVQELNPTHVVYDRFMAEEQYGWRVREQCPAAMTILDTEDLHLLRAARQTAVQKNKDLDLYSAVAQREIASILRCDLSLMISMVEMELLQQEFQLSADLLLYLPFLEEEIELSHQQRWTPFAERANFMFIGNFIHEPNWHTVQRLKTSIWPALRKLLPTAELHIYGAYATAKVQQLHKPQERFFIKDRADDARATLQQYRLLLAPIAFGAGAKGKFIDAMQAGTPSVSSSIGAESMTTDGRWGGAIEDDDTAFVQQAAALYSDSQRWQQAQQQGGLLLNSQYSRKVFIPQLHERIHSIQQQLQAHRNRNFIGQILHSQQVNSLKYMSLWIAEKNKPSTG